MSEPQILTRRQLNRALLARQFLVHRLDRPVVEVVEHLAPMQAQVPVEPYVALWSGLEPFDPKDLSGLLESRRAVRGPLHRATLHLVTARDYLRFRPLVQPVLERMFWSGSPFGKRLAGADVPAVLDAAAEALDESPRTKSELRSILGSRWPELDQEALAYAVTYLLPLVQVTPRGLWGRSGQPTWARAETWLGAALDAEPSMDELVVRYLRAWGPARVMDAQNWSGLTRLGAVFERLRPGLLTFRDASGRELFDVPDAPRPDPDTPAPVRLLPQYDNVLLGHADRSRIVPDLPIGDADAMLGVGTFLVEGMVAGIWRIQDSGRDPVLQLVEAVPLRDAKRGEVEAEAGRLLEFLRPKAVARDIRFIERFGPGLSPVGRFQPGQSSGWPMHPSWCSLSATGPRTSSPSTSATSGRSRQRTGRPFASCRWMRDALGAGVRLCCRTSRPHTLSTMALQGRPRNEREPKAFEECGRALEDDRSQPVRFHTEP